jgi:hypothetical protein
VRLNLRPSRLRADAPSSLLEMSYTPEDLAFTLSAADPEDYVRIVADWLTHGAPGSRRPASVGDEVIDALVAAAVAHLARAAGQEPPTWTRAPDRILGFFWHPGSERFFAMALAHAPAEFAARGLFIDADSLVSV